MSRLPWCAWYPSDFITGVQGMNAEQIGVYSVLLNMMYARRKKLAAKTATDKAGLARSCGLSTRRFNQVVCELLSMPNKLTADSDGSLSNPRFDKWVEKQIDGPEKDDLNPPQNEVTHNKNKDLFENTPQPDKSEPKTPQKNGPRTLISNLSQDKTDLIIPQNSPTFCKNNDLAATSRARARPRNQKEESKCVTTGSGGSADTPPPEHTQSDDAFRQWAAACRRTIPKGWKADLALKRWRQLPAHPVAIWISAWDCYIEHNRQQSEKARWSQKTSYPENWWKSGGYRDFLDEAITRAQHHQDATEKRKAALLRFHPHGPAILAKIGAPKFDAWLLETDFVITAPPLAELRVAKPFQQKWLRDHPEIVRAIEAVTGTSITVTGPSLPASAASG